VRLVFLGTGASGGTPGRGHSRRRESSLLVDGDAHVLLDVTRDAAEQLEGVARLDAVLLTHAHRDATGGIPTLRRREDARPLPVFAHPQTIAALRRRYVRLDHCEMIPVSPGRPFGFGPWKLCAIEVPHAPRPDTPTLAWKVATKDGTLVYASDVARPDPRLARFARRADTLVVDGATYGRTIFTHLRIDRDLPSICTWEVERILLTQIGRSAPAHAELERRVSALCARACPAYDGLVVEL
jgi:phosphoribosyl 1,2-cyclic phosphodiesterase